MQNHRSWAVDKVEMKVWESRALPVSRWVTRSQRSRSRTVPPVPYTEWWPLPTSKTHTDTHRRRRNRSVLQLHQLLKGGQQLSRMVGIHLVRIFLSRSRGRRRRTSLSPLQRTWDTDGEYKAIVTPTHSIDTMMVWFQLSYPRYTEYIYGYCKAIFSKIKVWAGNTEFKSCQIC